jgi:hypothetical protein
VVNTLETNLNQLRTKQQQDIRQRRGGQVVQAIRTTLSCLILAIVFAACAISRGQGPSLLAQTLIRTL